ncbi:vitamin K epoxide reductase family protein [Pontibacter rugosus]|uniref:Vitamin K epoxide reductase family protein n=1 Tax=Pontibacter rugosus TaxID=1745966 RepID=A0ABW3SUC4_9BACT
MSNNEGIPPGWSYNPATWGQRLPIIGLAVIGMAIASYMALFQLNVFSTVWEPFFGNDSRKILTSATSKILPIPDAALGAIGYLADAVTGAIGGKFRWRTMPWIVIMFGLAVGPLGFISILLVVLQPVIYDAWCTLCLCSALISVIMIGPAMDEMLASMQYMKRVKASNVSLWKAFWGYKEVQGKVI